MFAAQFRWPRSMVSGCCPRCPAQFGRPGKWRRGRRPPAILSNSQFFDGMSTKELTRHRSKVPSTHQLVIGFCVERMCLCRPAGEAQCIAPPEK